MPIRVSWYHTSMAGHNVEIPSGPCSRNSAFVIPLRMIGMFLSALALNSFEKRWASMEQFQHGVHTRTSSGRCYGGD